MNVEPCLLNLEPIDAIASVAQSVLSLLHEPRSWRSEWWMPANTHVCSNSSVFLTKVSKGLIFGGCHPAWRNLTFGKVCEEDLFVTASNYSGTEGTGERGGIEGLWKKMARAYLNVTSTRWMRKLLFFFFFKHYMCISHNGKKHFFAIFYSVCVSPCLSVWLRQHYWQRALSLVKLCQHLDSNHKPFSCLFCVGSDGRTNHSAPIWFCGLCWTVYALVYNTY